MFRRSVVSSLVVLALACAACGGRTSAPAPGGESAATATGESPATATGDNNQIRLTAAESSRLVSWLVTFRACMLTKGNELGPLEKSETQIRMAIPSSVDLEPLLADTETCGDAQGGPPHSSSLQYRPGEIVLYLPKQCLLDKKVVAS